jgi:DNA-binding HxlR family transcriptional regulator
VNVENTGCEDNCPVRKTAEIIEGKWTTLIVRELLSGKKRYSELQKTLAGISPKVLSARLRFLAEKGLVERTVHATIPPTTEYELTTLGRQLNKVIFSMAEFGHLL